MSAVSPNLVLDPVESGFSAAEIAQAESLKSGFSSDVFRVGSFAVKIVKKDYASSDEAAEKAALLEGEQAQINEYLTNKFMLPAEFSVALCDDDRYRVVAKQLFVQGGMTIKQARRAGLDMEPAVNLLERALQMYYDTHSIPDLCCLERLFNPLTDPNIQVYKEGGLTVTRAVDTTFGNTQRLPYLGTGLSFAIATGVEIANVRLLTPT